MGRVEGDVFPEANTVSGVGAITESCEVEPRVESTGLNGEVKMLIDCMLVSLTLFDAPPFI